jgi:hypothetical protein
MCSLSRMRGTVPAITLMRGEMVGTGRGLKHNSLQPRTRRPGRNRLHVWKSPLKPPACYFPSSQPRCTKDRRKQASPKALQVSEQCGLASWRRRKRHTDGALGQASDVIVGTLFADNAITRRGPRDQGPGCRQPACCALTCAPTFKPLIFNHRKILPGEVSAAGNFFWLSWLNASR